MCYAASPSRAGGSPAPASGRGSSRRTPDRDLTGAAGGATLLFRGKLPSSPLEGTACPLCRGRPRRYRPRLCRTSFGAIGRDGGRLFVSAPGRCAVLARPARSVSDEPLEPVARPPHRPPSFPSPAVALCVGGFAPETPLGLGSGWPSPARRAFDGLVMASGGVAACCCSGWPKPPRRHHTGNRPAAAADLTFGGGRKRGAEPLLARPPVLHEEHIPASSDPQRSNHRRRCYNEFGFASPAWRKGWLWLSLPLKLLGTSHHVRDSVEAP